MSLEESWEQLCVLLIENSPSAGDKFIQLLLNAKEERLSFLTRTVEFLNAEENKSFYVQGVCTFIQSILKLMIHSYQLSYDAVGEMVNFIIVEARHFSSSALVKNVSYCLKFMSENNDVDLPLRWIELFGKMVATLATRGEIQTSSEEIVDGQEYKKEVITAICRINWRPHNGASLIAALREIPGIDAQEVKIILEEAGSFIRTLEPASIPPMAYQLLLLAGKSFPSLIIGYFDEYFSDFREDEASTQQEQTASLNKRKALGTTVYHFVQEARRCEPLLKELIKRIKASQFHHSLVVSPFMISVSLGLTGIDCIKPVIIDSIKVTILKWFMEIHLSKSLRWYFESSGLVDNDSVMSCFARAIDSRTSEMDFMLDGVKELGIGLLNTDISGSKELQWAKKECSAIGTHLLKSMVSKEKDYLPVLMNEFLKNQHSVTNTECLGQCLKQVVSPFIRKKFVGRITELIHHLPLMTVETATPILKALLPALQIHRDLLNEVVMVLRKTIWKSVEARKISVTVMILLLSNSRIVGEIPRSQYSCSQSQDFALSQSMSQTTNVLGSSNKNESTCFEVLTILKRFFTQQAEVKEHLYIGLYNVARQNPELIPFLCSHILTQMQDHVKGTSTSNRSLCFEKIAQFSSGKLVVIEPIGFLIQCMGFLLTKSRQIFGTADGDFSEDTPPSVLKCGELMQSAIISYMHFIGTNDLDRLVTHILPPGQPLELSYQVKAECAMLVLQAIEATIEYLCLGGKPYSETDLVVLYKKFSEISEWLKPTPLGKKGKGKGKKKKAKEEPANESDELTLNLSGAESTTTDFLQPKQKLTPSKKLVYDHITAIEHVSQILHKIYNPDEIDPNEQLFSISQDSDLKLDFEVYLLGIVKQKLNLLKQKEPLKEREKQIKVLNTHFAKIAHVLWKESGRTPDSMANNETELSDMESRIVGVDEQRLEIASEILEYLFTNFASHRKFLLSHFLNVNLASETYDELFVKFFKQFKNHVLSAKKYSLRTEDKNLKAVNSIFKILECISLDLTTDSTKVLEYVVNWYREFLSEDSALFHEANGKNPQPSHAESILSGYISISSKLQVDPDHFLRLVKQVHYLLDDSEGNTPKSVPQGSQQCWLVTSQTVCTVLHQFSLYIENTLGVIKNVIGRLNCIYVDEDKASSWRDSCCNVMYFLMKILAHFVRSRFSVGPWVDVLRRTAVQFFNVLTGITESFVNFHSKSNIGFRSKPFETLIKEVGTDFKIRAEAMVQHIESIRTLALEESAEKKKKTAKFYITKDTKTIPALVYSISKYEQQLIALSRKTQVNFLTGMRLAAARDFRIKFDKIPAARSRGNAGDEGNETVRPTRNLNNVGRNTHESAWTTNNKDSRAGPTASRRDSTASVVSISSDQDSEVDSRPSTSRQNHQSRSLLSISPPSTPQSSPQPSRYSSPDSDSSIPVASGVIPNSRPGPLCSKLDLPNTVTMRKPFRFRPPAPGARENEVELARNHNVSGRGAFSPSAVSQRSTPLISSSRADGTERGRSTVPSKSRVDTNNDDSDRERSLSPIIISQRSARIIELARAERGDSISPITSSHRETSIINPIRPKGRSEYEKSASLTPIIPSLNPVKAARQETEKEKELEHTRPANSSQASCSMFDTSSQRPGPLCSKKPISSTSANAEPGPSKNSKISGKGEPIARNGFMVDPNDSEFEENNTTGGTILNETRKSSDGSSNRAHSHVSPFSSFKKPLLTQKRKMDEEDDSEEDDDEMLPLSNAAGLRPTPLTTYSRTSQVKRKLHSRNESGNTETSKSRMRSLGLRRK